MASLFCYGDEEKRARLRKRGLTAQIVQWTIALRGPEWNEEPLITDVYKRIAYQTESYVHFYRNLDIVFG